MKSKSTIKKIMAYIYMPLFFALLGYGIVILAALPLLKTFFSVGTLITSSSTPSFTTEINSIYDENEANKAKLNADKETELAAVTMPSFGEQYGVISCARIGMSAPLFWGDDSTILRNGVGQYIGSSLPGFNRPLLLCGHNNTYCLPLQYITEGDIIEISTNYGDYQYEVYKIITANLNDSTAYDLNATEEDLTIYTCYPFGLLTIMEKEYLYMLRKYPVRM